MGIKIYYICKINVITLMNIGERIKLIRYFVAAKFIRMCRAVGIKQDTSVIPSGMYCYVPDKERNANEPTDSFSYWIKPCKYYRSTPSSGGVACMYVGYFGFDPCLYDQCKLCGENYGDDTN